MPGEELRVQLCPSVLHAIPDPPFPPATHRLCAGVSFICVGPFTRIDDVVTFTEDMLEVYTKLLRYICPALLKVETKGPAELI
jgi:hypothetical protein